MIVDNLLQTNQGFQHPTGQGLLFHPTSKKPERIIEEHMKQEKSQLWNRTNVVAMEPLSINHNHYLDYRCPQSIKFFNKGRERLTGDPISGKNILFWLKRLEIKANEFQWIPTLTIDGKLLTTHFAELSMGTVKTAAHKSFKMRHKERLKTAECSSTASLHPSPNQ